MNAKNLLMGLGAVLLIVGGITAAGLFKFERTEKVVDLGAVQVERSEQQQLPLNWGYVLLGVGGSMVVLGFALRR